MAKKQKTPRTVLDAPVLTPVQPVAHRGPNRAARRHAVHPATGRRWVVPRALRQPATNVPHVKPKKPKPDGTKRPPDTRPPTKPKGRD